MIPRVVWCAAFLAITFNIPANAQSSAGSNVLQAFLTLWSKDAGMTQASVDRLYAPSVVYYGKRFSRQEVLADKLRFARHWPIRNYGQDPGSLKGSCSADGAHCILRAIITWSRETRSHVKTTGRAQLRLDFETVEGSRKIVRETARIL